MIHVSAMVKVWIELPLLLASVGFKHLLPHCAVLGDCESSE